MLAVWVPSAISKEYLQTYYSIFHCLIITTVLFCYLHILLFLFFLPYFSHCCFDVTIALLILSSYVNINLPKGLKTDISHWLQSCLFQINQLKLSV